MVLRKGFNNFVSRGRLDVVRHKRLLAELFNLERLALCEWVIRAHNQHQFILQNGKRFEVAIRGFKREQGEIHISIQHLTRQTFRYIAKDLNLYIWMLRSIFQDEMRQDV